MFWLLPIKVNINKSKVIKITADTSKIKLLENGNGVITALIAKTRNIFSIFEPIALPTTISTLPLRAATTEVANSGSEVPPATIVSATTPSFIPSSVAIAIAPFTIHLPPIANPASPIIIYNIDRNNE
jgi:hypothetical protein